MSTVQFSVGLPHGIIFELGLVEGADGIPRPGPNYKRIELKGRNAPHLIGANGQRILGSPGLTDVEESVAREVMRKYRWHSAVKNGLVQIVEKPADAAAV